MQDNPRLKAFARRMRKEPALTEQRLWRLLRGRRITAFKFRRQHWFGPYIADFYCPAANLVIELDGDSHAADGAAEADRERQTYLESLGLTVLRFWNAEVYENEDGVLTTICQSCMEGSSKSNQPPHPPGALRDPATSPAPRGRGVRRTTRRRVGRKGQRPTPLPAGRGRGRRPAKLGRRVRGRTH